MKCIQHSGKGKQSAFKPALKKAGSSLRLLKPFTLRGLVFSLLLIQLGNWTHVVSNVYAEPLQNPNLTQSNSTTSSNEYLVKRAQEIARLEAQINKNYDAYQKVPRRKFITQYTKEYRLKKYFEECLANIEKVTFLNPLKIHWALQLAISIKPDGSIENIEVSRPSGQRDVDEFAIQTIKLAAPFPPFPPEIAKDTDFLTIVGTWNVPLPNRQGTTP